MNVNLARFGSFKELIQFLKQTPTEVYFEGNLISSYGRILISKDSLKYYYKEALC